MTNPKGCAPMPYAPGRDHRRSIRLRGYDYAQPGAYFVTICTQGRQRLFDDPALCVIAEEQWRALDHAGARGDRAGRVSVDTWVVMPNHVHGIVVIGDGDGGDDADGGDGQVGAQQPDRHSYANGLVAAAPLLPIDADCHLDHALGINVAPGSLGAIVRSYKAAVARRLNRRRRAPGAQVWQRGYWERVIRDAQALAAMRRYILENPARWAEGRDDIDTLLAHMQVKE
jgi:REP-associated tyrosine transposase